MKPLARLISVAIMVLALSVSAFAQEQTPREQFQAAVVAYQKAPTRETALKVIELYKQLDPSPVVPEEAREPFVMGVTVLKKANDPTGAGKAADLFTLSLNVAPWFAEAYYNRALARETAGQFTGAMDDMKLYLEFKLPDSERRDVQDKIYSLKADAQLAAAKNAEVVAKRETADRESAAYSWMLGEWKLNDDMRLVADGSPFSSAPVSIVKTMKNGEQFLYRLGNADFLRATLNGQTVTWEHWLPTPYQIPGRTIKCPEDNAWTRIEVTISADKQNLRFSFYSSFSGTCGHQVVHNCTIAR